MSEETKIEWTTHTFNPWIGCTKVSPGCAHCYAEARDRRLGGGLHWGKGAPRQRTSAATWRNPVKWNRIEDTPGETPRPRVFPSLCDWLDDEVPIEWLADFLKLICETPHLDWLLLTKRPENWRRRLGEANDSMEPGSAARIMISKWVGSAALGLQSIPPENVWLGVSVEDQQRADERIPILLSIPANVRFLSVEPLLGPVDFSRIAEGQNHEFNALTGKQGWLTVNKHVDWIIVGGESGPKARPCNIEWIRSIVQQCKAAGVPCFVKQLGSQPKNYRGGPYWNGGEPIKHPKGGDPSEWPKDLRVREFPTPTQVRHE